MCCAGVSGCENFWWVPQNPSYPVPLMLCPPAYFVVSEPNRDSQWVNGLAHPVRWTKGVLDGITMLDVELARLTQDGLTFVARNGECDN